ncbi:hypothetical protein WOY_00526 [Enterococcus faecium EnGen0372]|nr:hypothetical protein WOY_00526 [Enterococcus faecium EnGen0372]EOK71224.1 hypothetical protein SE5_00619 [Enterococcus faecium EnGen0125]EOK78345.1 hypothetical protein SGY_00340 [Enterococcus faecium EnGen0145]
MRLKHFLITGIGLMLTGGLLAGATYTLGAQKSLTWDNGPRLIDMVTETKKSRMQTKSSSMQKIKQFRSYADWILR